MKYNEPADKGFPNPLLMVLLSLISYYLFKRLLALANHYGFVPKRCRIRRPQTKGYVAANLMLSWTG